MLFAGVAGVAAIECFAYAQAYPRSAVAALSGAGEAEGAREYIAIFSGVSRVAIPLLGAASLALQCASWRRLRAGLSADQLAVARCSAYSLAGFAVWISSEFWLSTGRAGVALDPYLERAWAPARDLASARLDHPWPVLGALVASTAVGWGALNCKLRALRVGMAGVALSALLQGLAAALELWLAQDIVAGDGPLARLSQVDARVGTARIAAGGSLLVMVGLGARSALRTPADGTRRVALGVLGAAGLLTALCFVDAARFVGVGSVAAADRLEQVLRDTHTRPLAAAEVAGGVRDRFAVLHADGGVTVVDRDRMTVSAHGDVLPTPGRELILIVDERCTVGQLRALVGRFPQSTAWGSGASRGASCEEALGRCARYVRRWRGAHSSPRRHRSWHGPMRGRSTWRASRRLPACVRCLRASRCACSARSRKRAPRAARIGWTPRGLGRGCCFRCASRDGAWHARSRSARGRDCTHGWRALHSGQFGLTQGVATAHRGFHGDRSDCDDYAPKNGKPRSHQRLRNAAPSARATSWASSHPLLHQKLA